LNIYKSHSAFIRKTVPELLKPEETEVKLKAVLVALWRITYIPVAKTLVEYFEDGFTLPSKLGDDFLKGEGAFLAENENIALVNPDVSIVPLLDTINDISQPDTYLKLGKVDLTEMLRPRSDINESAFSLRDSKDSEKRIINILRLKYFPSLWTVEYDKESASTELPVPAGKIEELKFENEITEEELLYEPSLTKAGLGFIKAFRGKILDDFPHGYKNTLSWEGVHKLTDELIDESFYYHMVMEQIRCYFKRRFQTNSVLFLE
jgi:hypothetical protein